jgi:hypothetical protein
VRINVRFGQVGIRIGWTCLITPACGNSHAWSPTGGPFWRLTRSINLLAVVVMHWSVSDRYRTFPPSSTIGIPGHRSVAAGGQRLRLQ